MPRCAIVDLKVNKVINVVEYATPPVGVPESFPDTCVAIVSDIASPGWIYENGALVNPTVEDLVAKKKAQALAFLAQSDTTILRSLEKGATISKTWRDYRETLRNIFRTGSGEIPPQPTYDP